MNIDDFRDIRLVTCDYTRPQGERPTPTRLTACEQRTGRILFVTFDAPAALGCILSPGDYGLNDAPSHFGLEGEGVDALGKLSTRSLTRPFQVTVRPVSSKRMWAVAAEGVCRCTVLRRDPFFQPRRALHRLPRRRATL